MAIKISSTEADYDPICPHCQETVQEVNWRMMQAVNAEYLFTCPRCRKILGVGVRKAAWIN